MTVLLRVQCIVGAIGIIAMAGCGGSQSVPTKPVSNDVISVPKNVPGYPDYKGKLTPPPMSKTTAQGMMAPPAGLPGGK